MRRSLYQEELLVLVGYNVNLRHGLGRDRAAGDNTVNEAIELRDVKSRVEKLVCLLDADRRQLFEEELNEE